MSIVTMLTTLADEDAFFCRQSRLVDGFNILPKSRDEQDPLEFADNSLYKHMLRVGNITVFFQFEGAKSVPGPISFQDYRTYDGCSCEPEELSTFYRLAYPASPSCQITLAPGPSDMFDFQDRPDMWSLDHSQEFSWEGPIVISPEPSNLKDLEEVNPSAASRLMLLSQLDNGWDGYGGNSPTQEAIRNTASLLLVMKGLVREELRNPFIVPLPDGGVELDWTTDSGVELMIVMPPEGGDAEYLLETPTETYGEFESLEGLLTADIRLSDLVTRITR